MSRTLDDLATGCDGDHPGPCPGDECWQTDPEPSADGCTRCEWMRACPHGTMEGPAACSKCNEDPDAPLQVATLTEASAGALRTVKRLRELEEAVGAWLHIRDQIGGIEDLLSMGVAQYGGVEAGPEDAATLERLERALESYGKAELLAVHRLRDIMEAG